MIVVFMEEKYFVTNHSLYIHIKIAMFIFYTADKQNSANTDLRLY